MKGVKPGLAGMPAEYLEFTPTEVNILVEDVDPGPGQAGAGRPDRLLNLRESLKQNGLLQPIGIRGRGGKKGDGYVFDVIWGRKRLWATLLNLEEARQAGDEQEIIRWEQIKATKFPAGTPDEFVALCEVVENWQRATTSKGRKARARVVRKLTEKGLSTRDIGRALGVDQKTVCNDLKAEERSSVPTSPDLPQAKPPRARRLDLKFFPSDAAGAIVRAFERRLKSGEMTREDILRARDALNEFVNKLEA